MLISRALFLYFTLISVITVAQDIRELSGTVRDLESGETISGCYIKVSGTELTTLSDSKGHFMIAIPSTYSAATIEFNKINYQEKQVNVECQLFPERNISIGDVTMLFLSYVMPEVNITSGPDIVWSDDLLNVADFAFIDDKFLLLTYTEELRWKKQSESKITLFNNCSLILCNAQGNNLDTIQIHEPAISFYHQYPDALFLKCRDRTFLVEISDKDILLSVVNQNEFEKYISPVIARHDHLLCVSDYDPYYPDFNYSIYNTKDSSAFRLRAMKDEELMGQFRSEYLFLSPREKLEAFRFEISTGIDKEIVAAYMSGFQHSIYYQPQNNPLLASYDDLLVFDHTHSQIIRYDWQGDAIDSTAISYHKTKKPQRWSETIIQDDESGEIFTWFMQNGHCMLKKIDPTTGTISNEFTLTHRFPENIQIHGGYVYYVYRPFESTQNRFLYREKN